MKKTQKEIINDLNWYESYLINEVKESRKMYYLTDDTSYRKDGYFHDFLNKRSQLMLIFDILGKYDSMKNKFDILVY